MDDPHDDDCRCMACCAAKFKQLDPAAFGKSPVQRICNHRLYNARCWLVPPER